MSPLFVRNNNVIAAEQLRQIGDVGGHVGLGDDQFNCCIEDRGQIDSEKKSKGE